jgi:hypothetical protein
MGSGGMFLLVVPRSPGGRSATTVTPFPVTVAVHRSDGRGTTRNPHGWQWPPHQVRAGAPLMWCPVRPGTPASARPARPGRTHL